MNYIFQQVAQEPNLNSYSNCIGCISYINANQLYGFGQSAKIIENEQLKPHNEQFFEQTNLSQIIKQIVCQLNTSHYFPQHLLIGKKVQKRSKSIKKKLLQKFQNQKQITRVNRKFTNLSQEQSNYSCRFIQGYSFNKNERYELQKKIKREIKNCINPKEQMSKIHQYIKINFVPIQHNSQSQIHENQYIIRISLQLQKLSKYMFYCFNQSFPQFFFGSNSYEEVKGDKLYKMIHKKYKREQKIIQKHKCLQPLVVIDGNEKSQLDLSIQRKIILNETIGQYTIKHTKYLTFWSKEELIKKFNQKKIYIQILQLPLINQQKRQEFLYFYFKQSSDEKKLHSSILKELEEKIKWYRVSEIIKIQGNNNPQSRIAQIERQAIIQRHEYRRENSPNQNINHYFKYPNQQYSAVVAVYLHDKQINYQFFVE